MEGSARPPRPAPPIDLVCAECGRRVVRRGSGSGFGHRSRGAVAACDLDTDHAAVPDWRAAGRVTCALCGEPAIGREGNVLGHVDARLDAGHAPDPWGS